MTSGEWKLSPVILLERELGVATDTGEVRVGDGKSKWSSLPVIKGAKGDQGVQGIQGKQGIQGARGATGQTGARGEKGDSIKVSSTSTDSQGNTVVIFSDGSSVTIPKGEKGERGATGEKGATGDTGPKGDKGDPLKFEDLTQEQINQIKAQDVDLSNYATKDDLAKVDVSSQLEDYAKKDHRHKIADVDGLQDELNNRAKSSHTHEIEDVDGLKGALDGKASSTHTHSDLVKEVGVDSNGKIAYLQGSSWRRTSSSSFNREVALKNHTHDEYLKKGDPIELTSTQKAELKGETGPKGATGASGTSVSIRSTSQNASRRVTTVTFSNGTSIEVPWGKDGTDGARGQQGIAGQPGKGIVNTRTGSEMKYWAGSQADYNRISTKDPNTVYDVWE